MGYLKFALPWGQQRYQRGGGWRFCRVGERCLEEDLDGSPSHPPQVHTLGLFVARRPRSLNTLSGIVGVKVTHEESSIGPF